jgi:hypothetical protein
MAYTITGFITTDALSVSESTDLTLTWTQTTGKQIYAIVSQAGTLSCLSLTRIETRLPPFDRTQKVVTTLTPLLTDLFVAQYKTSGIPVKTPHGQYAHRLRVFSPFSYGDHSVHFTSVDTPDIRDDIEKRGYLDDLVITSSADMRFYLVAVNGVFHQTRLLNNNLFVLDGFRTMRLSGQKDITIIDTRSIGGHSIIPLTTAMVRQSVYNDKAVVTTQESLTGKTILPVIDGYLYHPTDDVARVKADKTLCLYPHKMPLIEQFRHNPRTVYRTDLYGPDATQSSRKYIDAYAALFLNTRSVGADEFTTQAFQYSRLTAYHSFLVCLNSDKVFAQTKTLMPSGTPQMWEDPSNGLVSGVCRLGCGLSPSYLIVEDVFSRKRVYLSGQDQDVDYQSQSHSPAFIPSLTQNPEDATKTSCRMIDYITA